MSLVTVERACVSYCMYVHIYTYIIPMYIRTRQRHQALHPSNQARAERQLPQRALQHLQTGDFGHLSLVWLMLWWWWWWLSITSMTQNAITRPDHHKHQPQTTQSLTHLQPLRPHHRQRLHPRLQRHAVPRGHDPGGGGGRRVQPPFLPSFPMRVVVVMVVAAAAPSTAAGGSGVRCCRGGCCWFWLFGVGLD